MRNFDFQKEKINPYRQVLYRRDETGYIAWRRGTGDNTELLHIHTNERGRGHGRKLFYWMLDSLIEEPPYYSVFGFTRVSNEEAHAFYQALGFELQEIHGVYKDGRAILFWQAYDKLKALREEYDAQRP